jgi:uncharacterized membrane protein
MTMIKRHADPDDSVVALSYNQRDDDTEQKGESLSPSIQDSHTRSLLKGISWRFFATMTTMTIAWYITGTLQTAFEIGIIEFFLKIGIYYVHERIWATVRL